jgi:hypothetical protein
LPGPMKRRQFGAYLKAQWARVTVLKEPAAIAVALLLLAGGVYGARAAYPLVAMLWAPGETEQLAERLRSARKLCGSQQVGEFQGGYEVSLPDRERASPLDAEEEPSLRSLRILRDRMVFEGPGEDSSLKVEYCFTRVIERKSGSLHAEALLLIGRADPEAEVLGMSTGVESGLYDVRLDRGSERTRLRLAQLPMHRVDAAVVMDLRREE